MTFFWWSAAGTLTVIGAALYRWELAILSAANPAARLPWFRWPASTPRSAKILGFFGTLPSSLAVDCVFDGLGRRHLYDILWGLPIVLIVLVVLMVPQARHNRRVRRTA